MVQNAKQHFLMTNPKTKFPEFDTENANLANLLSNSGQSSRWKEITEKLHYYERIALLTEPD